MSTDDFLSDYIAEDELAETLKVTKRTLRSWRQQRIGPAWVKPTKDLIAYPRLGLRAWLEAKTVRPAGDKAA